MENHFEKMPIGIMLLIVAVSLEIFREIYSYFTQYNLFFGFYMTGTAFNIVNTGLLVFSIVVLFGFIIISKNLLHYLIGYYFVMILNSLLVIINSGSLSAITKINIGSMIFLHSINILLFALTMWYIFEKKTLFLHKKDDNLSVDNFFVIVYVIFFILMIILSFAFTAGI